MFEQIFTLIVAPILVGLAKELISRWFDEEGND